MLLKFALLIIYSTYANGIIFGNSGACCCSCGIPMPTICGCNIKLPTCPPPLPCPPPICPICQTCPAPRPCPPPPVAVCPAPQPVYVQPNCGCQAGGTPRLESEVAPPPPILPMIGPSQGSEVPFAHSFPQPASSVDSYQAPLTQLAPAQQQQQIYESVTTSDQTHSTEAERSSYNIDVQANASEALRRARGAVTISENKCNSAVLQELLTKHIDDLDPVASKRSIHKAATEEVRNSVIDIICSDSGFTYIVSTAEYCEAQKNKVICFIYKKS